MNLVGVDGGWHPISIHELINATQAPLTGSCAHRLCALRACTTRPNRLEVICHLMNDDDLLHEANTSQQLF